MVRCNIFKAMENKHLECDVTAYTWRLINMVNLEEEKSDLTQLL